MTALHIACAADGGYVPHSAAMLHSVLARRGRRPVAVHYLHGPGLAAADRDRIAAMVGAGGASVSFVEVPAAAVEGLPARDYFTPAMWYRILLPELLPDLDRVIYLDVDIIVLDSLDPLWEQDLGDHLLGAVTNVFEPEHLGRPAELGLGGPDAYFNTGVLLLDLARLRRERATQALRRYALEHREQLLWPDQDTFNVVLRGRRLPLDPRWNCMNSVLRLERSATVFGAEVAARACRDPAIRHFEGPAQNKPWHYLSEPSMRALYLEHRRQTPWPRCRLDGATLANRAARLVHSLRAGRRAQPAG